MIRVPLIPLPYGEKPFECIGMDIIDPLLLKWVGNKYILVVCDKGPRYPEAILFTFHGCTACCWGTSEVFLKVGTCWEIDQGANFKSTLLSELYYLLKIQPNQNKPTPPTNWWIGKKTNPQIHAMENHLIHPMFAFHISGGYPSLYGIFSFWVIVRQTSAVSFGYYQRDVWGTQKKMNWKCSIICIY